MGMAASQVRLLQLTQRGNDVRCKLTQLATDKMSLARDMNKVTRKYQEALSTKTLKWTNNGGVDYIDLTYGNMMYPNCANNNKLHMITDRNGKIVVDDKYKKYAAMISPDGMPGDWDAHRAEILSGLTGLSADDINNAEGYYYAFLDNQAELAEIIENEPERNFIVKNNHSTLDLFERMGACSGVSDWKKAYNDGTEVSSSNIKSIMESFKSNLGKYFMEDREKFEAACDSVGNWGNPNDKVTVQELIDYLVGTYAVKGGYVAGGTCADPHTGASNIVWYDVDSDKYRVYQEKYAAWESDKKEAEDNMNTALSLYNQLFTADVKSEIDFYDALFSSIAENGWTYNDRVSDIEYLNNMFMNGMYNITTVERNRVEKDHTYTYENEYNTDIALNCTNIVQVSDADVRDEALVRYEKEKSIINMKESRIDTRMKNLETEQAAIKQMMESVKNVIKNNTEQHMNIFSA